MIVGTAVSIRVGALDCGEYGFFDRVAIGCLLGTDVRTADGCVTGAAVVPFVLITLGALLKITGILTAKLAVGMTLGRVVGAAVGKLDGADVGFSVGAAFGVADGADIGLTDGTIVGSLVG